MSTSSQPQRHWVNSYGDVPADIDPDRHPSLVAMLDQAIAAYAAQPALHSVGQALSYAALDRRADALCAYLQHELGIVKGDRVAVMLPNLAAFPIALLAILRAGAVQVNVNPLYTPRELAHQLKDSGARAVVIFNGSTPTLAEALAELPAQNPPLAVLTCGLADGLDRPLPGPAVDPRLGQRVTLAQAIESGMALVRQPVALQGADLALLQYTGGTTGVSKGAQLSHRNIVANIEQFKSFMPQGMRPGVEVLVTAIPLYHIFALTVSLGYLSVGADNWLVANPRDMDSFLATLKAARPTVFPGVNTLYAALTQHPQIGSVDWSSLRLSVGGGAAVLPVVSERWQALTGRVILEGYGLSETSPVVSFNPAHLETFSGTTGLPMPSTDVRLLDDDGQPVAIGQAGEICVKGPQVMSGYWQQPEANASAFTADGYFRTGDVGVFDAHGFLKIVDRKKDMVIVSGFNVYPNDVEAVASACPGVAECACVGAADDKTGEAVKLFVVRLPGATLSEDEVIAHCRASMTGYKVPKIVRFIDALPKTNVGKILRRALRDVA